MSTNSVALTIGGQAWDFSNVDHALGRWLRLQPNPGATNSAGRSLGKRQSSDGVKDAAWTYE